jgi:hypothetical protein
MLNRIFPKQADNAAYRGWRAAIWLMVPILIVRAGEGINSMWDTRHVAITADGIPLDRYDPAAAATVLLLFALLGMWLTLQALFGTIVLVRYRALLPLTYLLTLLQFAGNRIIGTLHPIVSGGATKVGAFDTGALVTYGLWGLLIVGFGLSLLPRRQTP